jgi:hypothetical protein
VVSGIVASQWFALLFVFGRLRKPDIPWIFSVLPAAARIVPYLKLGHDQFLSHLLKSLDILFRHFNSSLSPSSLACWLQLHVSAKPAIIRLQFVKHIRVIALLYVKMLTFLILSSF